MPEPIQDHRRYLPHYQEPGQIISITWRLEGDLPQHIKATLQEMKLLLAKMNTKPVKAISSELYEQYRNTISRYDDQLGRH